MSVETQKIIDEIAEIIRRCGKRSEIEMAVLNDISFADLIAEQLKVEGPVREMAIRAVVNYLKGLEIEPDSELSREIEESIDFKKVIPELSKSEEFQNAITTAITDAVENGNFDVSGAFDDAIDAGTLDTPEIKKLIGEKVKIYIEDWDMSNLSDDANEKIEEIVFSEENIQSCLEGKREDINDLLLKQIETTLSTDWNGYNDYEFNPVVKALNNSKAFKAAIDNAVEELSKSDKMEKLLEKTVTSMLSGDESNLRSKLVEAISSKLMNKIAQTIVDRTFPQ